MNKIEQLTQQQYNAAIQLSQTCVQIEEHEIRLKKLKVMNSIMLDDIRALTTQLLAAQAAGPATEPQLH